MPEEKYDWERLGRVWREPPADPLPDLVATLNKRTRRIWLLTALDVLITIAALAILGQAVANGMDTAERWTAIALVAMLGFGWWCTLTVRRGTWQSTGSDTQSMLALAIRRCSASIRMARLNQAAVVVGLVAGIIARLTNLPIPDIDLGPDGIELPRTLVRTAAVLLFASWLGGAEWYARRKITERSQLQELRAQLCEDNSTD